MVALLIREAYSTFIRYSGTSYEKVLAARQASGYRNKRGVRKIRRLPIYHFDESSDGRLLYAINGDKVFFMFQIHPRIPETDRSLSRLPQSLSQITQNLFARSRTRLHAGGSAKAKGSLIFSFLLAGKSPPQKQLSFRDLTRTYNESRSFSYSMSANRL